MSHSRVRFCFYFAGIFSREIVLSSLLWYFYFNDPLYFLTRGFLIALQFLSFGFVFYRGVFLLWMDLAYDNDSQGAFGLGWLFFCMFELIGRVVSETDDCAGRAGTASRGQVTEVSLLCWQLTYFVAIGLSSRRGSTNRTLNVGMAQMFGGLLFFF